MRERLAEYSLSLHPDKTRLIEFGRFAAAQRARRGLGKPETFRFLGFTFICVTPRALRSEAEIAGRSNAGEAQGNQKGVAIAKASANPRAGEMVEASRSRLLCISCRAD